MPNCTLDNSSFLYYISRMKLAEKKFIFTAIFTLIGLVTLQIPFTKLAGSNVSFTLFDFFGPIAGAFLGPVLGIISVLSVELANFFLRHTPITTGSIIRLFPMLFAVYYFAVASKKKKSIFILLVPVIAMIAFWVHPIGRQVWYYALFWTIPLFAYLKKDNLLVRSLGTTFIAHAVGGMAWIWAFNLPASVWNNLIPIVFAERMLFAFGIAGSYLVMKYVLRLLIAKKILPSFDSVGLSVK